MPHATKSFIDVLHDLRWRLGPAKFKELLPDVAGVAMNDCLWDATKKLVNHDGFVVLGDRIKSLLNDMAAKCIHGKIQCVSSDGLSDLDDLFRSSVLEATLNQEVSETIHHQWIGLGNNGLNNVVLLFSCADLKLLLKEDGSLLIVVADNLVNNVLPVAVNSAVKQTTVVERLSCWEIGSTLSGNYLKNG